MHKSKNKFTNFMLQRLSKILTVKTIKVQHHDYHYENMNKCSVKN